MKKKKQSRQRVASLIDWTTLFNLAVSSESLPPISKVLLKKARVHISDFGILRSDPYKTIKLEKKDDLQPDSDSPEEDQASSISENIDNSKDFKDSKKIPTPSNSKAIMKLLLVRKTLSWTQCQKCQNIEAIPLSWQKKIESKISMDLQVAMCILAIVMYN